MARKDQFSFDISGLREKIIDYRRGDRLWAKLSLSEKVRTLIELGLESDEPEAAEAVNLVREFVRAVAEQRSLEGFSAAEVADALGLETELIEKFWRCGNGSKAR